ncbi:MAG: hypothetical protein U5K37_03785 [Natrialbaceae archaeon]|nr:hypothetical protein [Natrialbaceae archaeon]
MAGPTIGDIDEMGLSSAHTVLVGDAENDSAGSAVGGGVDLTDSSASDLLVAVGNEDAALHTWSKVTSSNRAKSRSHSLRPLQPRPSQPQHQSSHRNGRISPLRS